MADNNENKDTIEYKRKRQRLVSTVLFTVVFTFLGVFASLQFGTAQSKAADESKKKQETIIRYENQINSLEEQIAVLSGDISGLKNDYDAKMEQLAESDNDFFRVIEFYNSSIAKYGFYAGTTSVTGKGIEISIDDGNPTSGTVSNYLLVHDSTLLNIIDNLRIAGAQAISVNGERIVMDTAVLCMGTGISINGNMKYAPFTIKAIGNSDELYSRFINGSIYRNIVMSDLLVDVTKSDSVKISGYTKFTGDSVKYLKDSDEE